MSTQPAAGPPVTRQPFGAILAGGRNRRYGSPKAMAHIAGEPILDRVRRALGAAASDLVLIANEPSVYRSAGLPMRLDARPGLGALGGIYSALLWAREVGRTGALVVACDMPFLSAPLLRRLLEERRTAQGEAATDVVAPESGGPRGVEPLCAYYSTGCISAIEAEIARGERHVVGFYQDVRVHRLPVDVVSGYGEPDILFMNVNTREQRKQAERIAAETRPEPSESTATGN